MELAFGIILLVAAVFLVVAVLMQHGKSYGLSGTISGGADTFFGKGKAQTIDKLLSKITTVVAVLFCILVIVLFMVQGKITDETAGTTASTAPTTSETAETPETDATEASETEAPEVSETTEE